MAAHAGFAGAGVIGRSKPWVAATVAIPYVLIPTLYARELFEEFGRDDTQSIAGCVRAMNMYWLRARKETLWRKPPLLRHIGTH
jgi:hypothetical protein